MTTTDTPKRLSDVELAKISVRSQERFSSEYFTARDAHRDRCDLLSHIAALTAPPSQGKVERVRELYRACYDEVCRKDTKQFPSREHLLQLCEDAAIAAITQALTESSGQGADGACCEAMREWQPIETAPKGREIIVCGGDYMQDGCTFDDWYPLESVALVQHIPDSYSKEKVWRGENAGGHDEYFWYRPTHWMDKPKPIKFKQPDTGETT